MEYNVREISNAVMINSLDTIIEQESLKLEMDKNTGLLATKSKLIHINQSAKQNTNTVSQNISLRSDTTKLNQSCDRTNEIDRLANLFTHSPSYITKNSNDNSLDVKNNRMLLKEKMATQTHNVFDNYNNVLINTENRENLVSPDIKVRRNVRFGEYSPLNPANQVNSQPYLGIGEYENKRKKILELQRKEYIDHLSKSKQENNVSNLPKLPAFSCNEAFKSAMENNNNSKQIKLGGNIDLHQEDTIQIVPPFVDGVESCAFSEEQIKDANRLKQELYRFELSKQIEQKKKYELERKHKEQMEDDKIERAAREQENKIKRAYEKEAEKRIMAQLQKQLQQEKLNHEIMQKQKDLEKKSWSMPSATVPRHEKINDKTMQKQKDLETKSWNMPLETLPQQVTKHVQSNGELFENCDTEEFHCPPQNSFDNVPLPTTRVRVPRKITYDEADIVDMNVSCDKDTFEKPCISPPEIVRQKMERAHVSFASDPPMKIKEYKPAALLPVTKTVIIDSPLTLALAGTGDNGEDFENIESIEPIEGTYRNQISKKVLLGNSHELPTDKHLLSNLGNIRKQLDIEHQKLKQQVRTTQ